MWRYRLFVLPNAGRWRVSILDDGARLPEPLQDFETEGLALSYAREMAADITRSGDEVRTIVSRPGAPTAIEVCDSAR